MQKKFASVGNAYLADVLRALADGAFKFLLGQIGLANQPTDFANVHLVAV